MKNTHNLLYRAGLTVALIVLSICFLYVGKHSRFPGVIGFTIVIFGIISGNIWWLFSRVRNFPEKTGISHILTFFLLFILLANVLCLILLIVSISVCPTDEVVLLGMLFLMVFIPSLVVVAFVWITATSHKQFDRVIFYCGTILFFLVTLLHVRFFVVISTRYLYTPPALTSKSLSVYKKCIELAKAQKENKPIAFLRRGWIFFDGRYYGVSKSSLEGLFSNEEISKIKSLLLKLRLARIDRFRRENNIILFYRAGTPMLPAYPEEFFFFLPTGPGVAYSLDGTNPNDMETPIIVSAKPFTQIKDNWYMSKKLVLVGLRSDKSVTLPESLFDHSLYLDGIDPNELDDPNL